MKSTLSVIPIIFLSISTARSEEITYSIVPEQSSGTITLEATGNFPAFDSAELSYSGTITTIFDVVDGNLTYQFTEGAISTSDFELSFLGQTAGVQNTVRRIFSPTPRLIDTTGPNWQSDLTGLNIITYQGQGLENGVITEDFGDNIAFETLQGNTVTLLPYVTPPSLGPSLPAPLVPTYRAIRINLLQEEITFVEGTTISLKEESTIIARKEIPFRTQYGYWLQSHGIPDEQYQASNHSGIPYQLLFAFDIDPDRTTSLPISFEQTNEGTVALSIPQNVQMAVEVQYSPDLKSPFRPIHEIFPGVDSSQLITDYPFDHAAPDFTVILPQEPPHLGFVRLIIDSP